MARGWRRDVHLKLRSHALDIELELGLLEFASDLLNFLGELQPNLFDLLFQSKLRFGKLRARGKLGKIEIPLFKLRKGYRDDPSPGAIVRSLGQPVVNVQNLRRVHGLKRCSLCEVPGIIPTPSFGSAPRSPLR